LCCIIFVGSLQNPKEICYSSKLQFCQKSSTAIYCTGNSLSLSLRRTPLGGAPVERRVASGQRGKVSFIEKQVKFSCCSGQRNLRIYTGRHNSSRLIHYQSLWHKKLLKDGAVYYAIVRNMSFL